MLSPLLPSLQFLSEITNYIVQDTNQQEKLNQMQSLLDCFFKVKIFFSFNIAVMDNNNLYEVYL